MPGEGSASQATSSLFTFTFCFQPDVPDPPENLRLSERQNRSVRLTWDAGDSHNSNISGRGGLGPLLLTLPTKRFPKPRLTRLAGSPVKPLLLLLLCPSLPLTHTRSCAVSPGYVVEFEGNREEPGRWETLTTVPGEETTVLLTLAPYVRYQFRVIAANEVGRSRPSRPSEHHETPPAGGSVHGFPSSISVGPRLAASTKNC